MTGNELRKLNRKQLLELLLRQTERADKLQKLLDEAEKKLQNKMMAETEAGSIAEAALKLNGVFEAAQSAADQYLENVKTLSQRQTAISRNIEAESQRKADAMVAEAQVRCAAIERESEKKLRDIQMKIQELYKQKQSLDAIFSQYEL